MANLMERRRNILLNTPHLETGNGYFSTDIIAPLKKLELTTSPKQIKNSQPQSLDNLWPLETYTRSEVTVNGILVQTGSFVSSLNIAAYKHDFVGGKLIQTHKRANITPSSLPKTAITTVSTLGNYTRFWIYFGTNRRKDSSNVLCNIAPKGSNYEAQTTQFGIMNTYPYSYWFTLPSSVVGTTQDSIWEYLTTYNPITITLELAFPIEYPMTAYEIKTQKGNNVITGDGTIETTFWTH